MGKGKLPLHMIDLYRLAVRTVGSAGGAVTHMSYGYASRRHLGEGILGKYLVYKSYILIRIKNAVIVNDDTAALLAAVLQCIQSVINCPAYRICCL